MSRSSASRRNRDGQGARRRAIDAGEQTVIGIARILKVGRNTLGRALTRIGTA